MRWTHALALTAALAGCGGENRQDQDPQKGYSTQPPENCDDVRILAIAEGERYFRSLVCREVSKAVYETSTDTRAAYGNLYCVCHEPDETQEGDDCKAIISDEAEGRRIIIDELERLGYRIDTTIDEIVLQDPQTREYSIHTRPDVAFFRGDGPFHYFEFLAPSEEPSPIEHSDIPFYRVVHPATACEIRAFVRTELSSRE